MGIEYLSGCCPHALLVEEPCYVDTDDLKEFIYIPLFNQSFPLPITEQRIVIIFPLSGHLHYLFHGCVSQQRVLLGLFDSKCNLLSQFVYSNTMNKERKSLTLSYTEAIMSIANYSVKSCFDHVGVSAFSWSHSAGSTDLI